MGMFHIAFDTEDMKKKTIVSYSSNAIVIQFLVKSVMFYSALRRLANGFHIYGSNSRYAEIDIQLMTQVCFFRKKKLWQNKWKIFRLFKNYFRWLLFLFHLILFFNGQLQVFEVTIYGIYTQWKITKMVGYEEPHVHIFMFYFTMLSQYCL